MRISLAHLRKIIFEEVSRLSEAPLADVYPTVDMRRRDQTIKADPKILARIQDSPLYRHNAEKTFKEFPQGVYILPVTIGGPRKKNAIPLPSWSRSILTDGDVGIAKLRDAVSAVNQDKLPGEDPVVLKDRLGQEIDLENLEREVAGGATLIVSMSNRAEKNINPTPWNIVHATLDAADDDSQQILRKEQDAIHGFIEDNAISESSLELRMTMKSAREGLLTVGAPNDYVCEIMTQAIVDRRGCIFIKSDEDFEKYSTEIKKSRRKPGSRMNEKWNAVFTEFQNFVNGLGLKQKYHNAMKGKVLFTYTSTIVEQDPTD